MQATLGFLQHYAPDATSLRALIATLAAQAYAHMRALYAALPAARSGDDGAPLDTHLRRDIGLGEFGAAHLPGPDADRI